MDFTQTLAAWFSIGGMIAYLFYRLGILTHKTDVNAENLSEFQKSIEKKIDRIIDKLIGDRE